MSTARNAKSKEAPIIGIDLGTTYSCVAVWQEAQERVEVIANDQGNRTTPSYVAFTDTERLIGDAAKNQAATNPENTIFDAKRLLGKTFDDAEVQRDMKHWPFKVVQGNKGKPVVEVMLEKETHRFEPEAISAMILQKMKDSAEAYLGCEVRQAVVTVPAYFNDLQRQATKDAGKIAGLEVLRIINEPTAAALAYGLDKTDDSEKTILVFDLGGGTFDVSLLVLDDGAFQVVATSGNPHLGGQDFDGCLVDYCQKEFLKKHRKDITGNKRAMRRLLTACERAKRTLSDQVRTTIEIEALCDNIDFSMSISQAKFDELCQALFKSTLEPVKDALESARIKKEKVDEVILVGGSTRIPKIRKLISEFFDGKTLNRSVNADEAVASGAVIQGAILSKSECTAIANIVLIDVLPLSLGVASVGDRRKSGGKDAGQDLQVMAKLIKRNTAIPTSAKETFTTAVDNQKAVSIQVYQGERGFVKDNLRLGEFTLKGLTPLPAGQSEIEVTFQVDVNGMLTVSAVEKLSGKYGKSGSVKIETNSQRLSKSQIDRMKADAERFKEEDAARAARIEALHELEEYVYSMQDRLTSDEGAHLSREDYETASEALNEEVEWMKENEDGSADVYAERRHALEQTLQSIMASEARTHTDDQQSGYPAREHSGEESD